jgi:CelD/BcsL family acetyltransferase involved in cellulose biosynthesis
MIDATLPAGEIRWVRKAAALEYDFAGRRMATVEFGANVCVSPFTHLGRHPPEAAAVAQLHRTDADLSVLYSHPVEHEIPRLTRIDGALRYVPRHFLHYWVDTSGTFDDYLARVSPKSRQTLKRKVRRFCAHVGCDEPWREYRTEEEVRRFHALARPLSSRTYQERLLDAGLPPETGFLDRLYATGGAARGFMLFDGDKPVAYLYTPVRQGRAVYRYLGYDTDYAEWSPGLVLQHFALSRMFPDAEIAMLDFTEGEGQHKSVFATGEAYCADVYYFRPTSRASAAVHAHIAIRAIDGLLMSALRRTRLHGRMRRMVRRRATSSP